MKLSTPRNRQVMISLAMIILVYLMFFPMREYLQGVQRAREIVMLGKQSTGEAPFVAMRRCWQLNGSCKAYLKAKLRGEGSVSKKIFPLNQYFALLILAGVLTLVFYMTRPKPQPTHAARWATDEDVEPLSLGPLVNNRKIDEAILLGQYHRMPDHTEEPYREHVLTGKKLPELARGILALPAGLGGRREIGHATTSGMTRSGKSANLIAQLYTWKKSIVVLDTRRELYRNTAGIRAELGKVFVISPEGRGHHYNPILELMDIPDGAYVAANAMLKPERETRPEFARRATQGIAATILAGAHYGVEPLQMMVNMVKGGQLEFFFEHVATIQDDEIRTLCNGFLGVKGVTDRPITQDDLDMAFSDKFLGSAWSVAMSTLRGMLTEDVLWTFSSSDFRAADILEENISLYLDFPESTLGVTKGIYDLVVQALIWCGSRHVDEKRDIEEVEGKRWYPPSPTFYALDELAVAPIENLPSILSTASARGMTMSLYYQDMSQLEDIYGIGGANSIVTNASVQSFYKTQSVHTSRFLNEVFGQTSVTAESESRVINRWFQPISQSRRSVERDIISKQEVRLMGGLNRQMLISAVAGLPPIFLKRVNSFENKKLKRILAAHPPPPVSRRRVTSKSVEAPTTNTPLRESEESSVRVEVINIPNESPHKKVHYPDDL